MRDTGPEHVFRTENAAIQVDRAARSMMMTDFSVDLCEWRNFLSDTCFGPASRLAFLTALNSECINNPISNKTEML
jgi:hypothetical protein